MNMFQNSAERTVVILDKVIARTANEIFLKDLYMIILM